MLLPNRGFPAANPLLGPFAGSCWEITVHFSLSAGATPDFLFTLRFTEGLLNSWPGPGGYAHGIQSRIFFRDTMGAWRRRRPAPGDRWLAPDAVAPPSPPVQIPGL